MSRASLGRPSIRAALAIGFSVTLGLWLVTGYTFTKRMEDVEREASEVAARYTRAQDLLASVRAQVLVSSVRVRDALLNSDPSAVAGYRKQIDAAYAAINRAMRDYVPVLGSDGEQAQVARLRQEVDAFHAITLSVLDDASGRTPDAVREVLNRHIVPRRETALRISEEIQSLNRAAFVRQQADIADIHRTAERQSWRRLGLSLATSLGIVLLATLYAGRLEDQLRRQMERDARLSRELQDAAARVMSAQEDERRTIARELHDEVGQVLTAIKMELSLAERALEAKGESGRPLAEVQEITDGALQTVRDLTQLLHPAVLDDIGLPAAIDASLRGLARRHDIHVDLHQSGMADRLDPETEVAAYRIVQEAITNIARHSCARHCRVRLRRHAAALSVDVEDDGLGFDAAVLQNGGRRGFGLIGIRERATHLGGSLRIESAPGLGTRIVAELPIQVVHA